MKIRLTRMEFKVFHGMMGREGTLEIAQRLGITKRCARFHVENIYKKLGVRKWPEFLMLFGHFEPRLVWVANKEAPKIAVLNYGRIVK